MTKKKTKSPISSSPDLNASRSNISTNKTATKNLIQFQQSSSVNALDSALKKQLVDKMSVRVNKHTRP